MKISLISTRPKLLDKQANIKKIEECIKKTNADFYVFGELSLTGYTIKDEIRDVAEDINGKSVKQIKKIAEKNNCYIVFGMPLKNSEVEDLIHNSAVLAHPDGKIDTYNKWFLTTFGPFEEKIYYDEGENIQICDTKFGRIGLIVCYDLFFPELCKMYSMQGVDVIICISASPSISRKYFETLLPARAIENTVFMVFVNLVGTQEDLVFWGGSQVYDPLAKLLIKAPYY
ncbi:MAG: carbon-nitrogen hydrolase family protein, partial [Candidatus Thermoplasmatota archaeon]|nr:carbon-nitrogen hydrolase family protein [Candidatus Thermoplasmatota archaeon]